MERCLLSGRTLRPGRDVALDILQLRLRLFHRELLVSARLLKHLTARCDATKGPTRSHGFDTGVEELFRGLEFMRRNSFDELPCASVLHRRNPNPLVTSCTLAHAGSRRSLDIIVPTRTRYSRLSPTDGGAR